jgi:ERCC4-type nuclease
MYAQENNYRVMYLIEGAWSSAKGRLGASALMKTCCRLQFHHNIPIIQTESVSETVSFLTSVMEYFQAKPDSFVSATTGDIIRVSDGIKVRKKDNKNTPKQFMIHSLCGCPGISPRIAEAIVEACGGDWNRLFSKLQSDGMSIANIRVNGRRIGPAIIERLNGLFAPP